MNKKFLTVIGSAAIAAAFWACGGGDIYEATDNDIVFKDLLSQSGALKNRCADSNGCDGAFDVESSSSSEEQVVESSSSNSGPAPQSSFSFRSSSSSIEVIPTSSEEAKPVTGLGSCAPLKSPVDKNTASAQFKFTPNATTSGYKPVDFAAATYEWDFGANGSAASNGGSTSQMVTYAASGSVTASVVVTMKDGSSEKITCTPLQVNGDPITGCACTTDAASVDFTETPDVTWKVAGCKSTSDITSYSWEGVAGADPSFTKTFATAQTGWAPKLKVGNSDKTVIDVTCPAVKTTSGPEYTLDIGENASQKPSKDKMSVDVKSGGCISIRGSWGNDGYKPSITVLCDMTATSSPVSFTMTTPSKKTYTATGATWGFSNAGGEVGSISGVGKIEIDGICLEFTGAETVNCYLQ
ncbi:MAG: hypothetical protein MJY93_06160 [Fibrobacter sp.]|nr:hypothetical protein [Fibrobacter sp.]